MCSSQVSFSFNVAAIYVKVEKFMKILVASNQAYLFPLQVMLCSLLECHKHVNEIDIYILHKNLSWSEICGLENEYDNCRLHPIQVESNVVNKLSSTDRFPVESCFRMIAHLVLPQDIERILWLDSDIVVNGSLTDFYSQDLSGAFAAACKDCLGKDPLKRFPRIELDSNKYFNAGVLLLNLHMLRQAITLDTISNYFSKYKESIKGLKAYPDQDALNALFENKVRLCHNKYNVFFGALHQRDFSREMYKNIVIIHFIYAPKPWKPLARRCYANRLWKKYAKISSRFGQKEKYYIYLVKRIVLSPLYAIVQLLTSFLVVLPKTVYEKANILFSQTKNDMASL